MACRSSRPPKGCWFFRYRVSNGPSLQNQESSFPYPRSAFWDKKGFIRFFIKRSKFKIKPHNGFLVADPFQKQPLIPYQLWICLIWKDTFTILVCNASKRIACSFLNSPSIPVWVDPSFAKSLWTMSIRLLILLPTIWASLDGVCLKKMSSSSN